MVKPPVPPENTEVTLDVRITFKKSVEVQNPEGDLHPCKIKCLPKKPKRIDIGPLGPLHDLDKATVDAAIRTRIQQRALISLALAFADIEFDQSVSQSRKGRPKCRYITEIDT